MSGIVISTYIGSSFEQIFDDSSDNSHQEHLVYKLHRNFVGLQNLAIKFEYDFEKASLTPRTPINCLHLLR